MVKGQESHKRFLLTIIERLPAYIAKYPQIEDYQFLTDFFDVLKFHDNRTYFTIKSEEYLDVYYRKHKKYFELPFLWFTTDYLNTANRILNADRFDQDRFYQYVVKHLRSNNKTQGIFDLVRDLTPLTSRKWECLQYSCNKITVPLTKAQLLILETVLSLIPKAGLRNLTHQRLQSAVTYRRKKMPKERRKKRRESHELQKCLTSLETLWNIRFYPSVFDLDRLYFYFQLSDSSSLSEILGLTDPINTTLGASTVYREKNFNNYLGILLLPKEMMKSMTIYLKQCGKHRKIKLYEVRKVIDIQISQSIKLYEAGKGWRALSKAEKRGIIGKSQKQTEKYVISPHFYTDWHFQEDREHGTPSQFVDLYCKAIKIAFGFDDLLSKDPSKKKNFRFSKSEQDLLSYLYDRKVIQFNFNPIRLMRDFSLDEFWIKPPKDISQNYFLNVISYLPYSFIISTKKNTFIWTRLTPEFVEWLSIDLGWSVISVIEQYAGKTKKEWFSHKTHEWISPRLLEDI